MERLEKLLIFRVGPAVCCVTSNSVETIIRPPEKETHGKEGNLPEIFRHGGQIARVVDVRKKFGLSPADNAADGNIILSKTPKGLFAFWVDQIINVIDADEGKWGMLPAKLPRDVFSATFMLNDEILLFTDFASIEQMKPSAGLTEHLEQLARKQAVAEVSQPSATTGGETAESVEESRASAPAPTEAVKPEPRPEPKPEPKPEIKPVTAAQPPKVEIPKPAPRPPAAAPRPAVEPRVATPRPTPTPAAAAKSAPKPEPAPTTPGWTPPPPQARPQTQAKDLDDDESTWPITAAIVLLLLFMAGGTWYFFNSFDDGPDLDSNRFVAEQDDTPPADTQDLLASTAEPAPTAVEPAKPTPSDTAPEPVNEADTSTPPAPTADEDYSATIEKKDKVVTITLNSPEGDNALIPQADEPSAAEPESTENTATDTQNPDETDTQQQTETTAAEQKTAPAAEEKPVQQNKPRVITHIVVKGDTLWAIAKKYVKDPFRYPELAKLSNIENPDRIYPGDIVRIQVQ